MLFFVKSLQSSVVISFITLTLHDPFTDLIDAIEEAAERGIPIFNIGLDSWFSIFGPDNWEDQELRLKLMNALARLNQTPDTTLDPNHTNFHGLVKGTFTELMSTPPRGGGGTLFLLLTGCAFLSGYRASFFNAK